MIRKTTNRNSSTVSHKIKLPSYSPSKLLGKGKGRVEMSLGSIYFIALLLLASTFVNGYFYGKNRALNVNPESNTIQANAPGQPSDPQPDEQAPQPQQDLTKIPEPSDKDYVRGNRKADVVLIEYSDYECPFCKRFHPTMQQVMKEYGDKVAWVYRHIPLNFHPKAQKTAEAAECAGDVGGNDAFWKMTDLIFEKMPSLELSELPAMAKQIGLNEGKFKSCLDSGKYADKINQQMKDADLAGINGTPGTVVIGKNGQRDFIGGAYPIDQVKSRIDAMLK